MISKYVLLAMLSMIGMLAIPPSRAAAQAPSVWAASPGPYEIHYYFHRTNSFSRAPYYATNPPVYYGYTRLGRSFGWTPYPYQGIQYQRPLSHQPSSMKRMGAPARSHRRETPTEYDRMREGRYARTGRVRYRYP